MKGLQAELLPTTAHELSLFSGLRTQIHRPLPYTSSVSEEGGRHWTDDEVRALLCVWADRRIRERLKSTLRNKCIFQEMAYQMQRNFGVVRNWKQCRTKYKNLKYDYKTAKSAHAAAGSGSGGPGKYMKFFEEVDAILMDRGLEDGTVEMQRRLFDGEVVAQRMQTPGSESEVVIEIDDDSNDGEMNGDVEAKWKRTDAHLTVTDPPDQFHVVTVPDTGRNWSEQEVRALVQIWSDERVCRQLESSTRKRDIFVQISNRLMQEGIDRDWKQCHTKYKNLKYLYRSLQRGMTEETDPRRIMRFYNEVDAIMNRTRNGSPNDTGAAQNRDSGRLSMSEDCEDKDHTDATLTKMEDRTCSSDSVSSVSLDIPANKEPRIHVVQEARSDLQHRFMSSLFSRAEREEKIFSPNRRKRKFTDQDSTLLTAVKKLHTHAGSADNTRVQCKEEEDHIPIIKINSVRSMASPDPSPDASPDRQVTSANPQTCMFLYLSLI
ncbi:multifunctional protein ADE2 isoform X2 [Notolabrus celidotus]|uniref:multifunctional protein ADE2 isoform X2 n=1 Tax=Notolabrus celidotus TaxID=1203425 RepID=UPI00148FE92F|nr:multifunctional protein ADE2 isoform X2 [Notolabrus celidotus]